MNKRIFSRLIFPNWCRAYSIVLVLTLFLALFPFVINSQETSTIQPVLLQMATERPDAQINVIVQKSDTSKQIEQSVVGLGGKVTADLHIINGFAAQIPAKAVTQLGQISGVRRVSLDAPVVKNSTSLSFNSSNLVNNYPKEIGAYSAWQDPNHYTGKGISIAVVDSGINQTSDLYTTSGYTRLISPAYFNTRLKSKSI